MAVPELLKIAAIVVAGGLIQSSVGFGFGLFALPPLLFLGLPLPDAVMIVILGSAIQKITAVRVLSHAFRWRELYPFMAAGLAALPLGIFLMFRLSAMDQTVTRQIIGALILVLLVLRRWGLMRPRDFVPVSWGMIASVFSGVLNGLANIGGPPMVLWVLAHRWSQEKMRVVLLAFSLIFAPFQVGLMILIFGSPILAAVLKALIMTPAVLLGTWIGLIIGRRISREQLQTAMRFLLLVIALTAILKPLL